MKQCWNLIREVIGTPKKCAKLPGYFKDGSKKVRSDKEIASGFNKFFSTIGFKRYICQH